ncbi:MAG: hypothetical protein U1C51_08105 [Candidatus Izemoplasmatales bacterium]|jgi:hypothetical protein|nr:hypothetical protein [bacterium]MDZ4197186.1 hypothetical protein [Candidatus Izemoplasmatales bacterium]
MKPSYQDLLHRNGRIFTIIGLVILLGIPIMISIISGVPPQYSAMFGAIITLSILYLPGGIVELTTYSPVLGTSATYLAFITGNLANLKIPCVLNARQLAKTEIGTEENEVVSTLAVAFSSITTIVIMALGVLLLAQLQPVLTNPVLRPAFDWVVPALFGALGYQYFIKNPKIIIVPLVFILLISALMPSFVQGNLSILIIVSAVVSVAWAKLLHTKKMI